MSGGGKSHSSGRSWASLGESQVPRRQIARGPLESSSRGDEVGRNVQVGLGGGSLPTGTHRRGSSRCALGEVLSKDLCAWGKEEMDPLQSGSLPVASCGASGAGGQGFIQALLLCALKPQSRKQLQNSAGLIYSFCRRSPGGEETCPEAHSWWVKLSYRVSKFSLAPGVPGLSMGVASGQSGGENGC